MRFTLRHLEVFAAIATLENVSAAADTLGMSQSAASTALAELERRSGRPLFERAGKRLRLNETGRKLLPYALEMIDRAGEIERLLEGRSGPGPLRLGATATIGNYLAPWVIERYRESYADAPVDLTIGNTREIAARVLEFGLDLGLIEGDYSHPDLIVSNWLDDELAVFCSPTHPLAAKRRCSLDRLLEERWAVREQGSGTRQTLDRAMSRHWTRWRIGIVLQQIEAIKATVEVGRMIGCLSRLALRDAFASGRLVEIKVDELDLRRRLYTVTHRERHMSAAITSFAAICQEVRAAGGMGSTASSGAPLSS